MAEAADELSTPLGQNTVGRTRRVRLPFTAMQALAVLLGLVLVGFAGVALFNDNPLGGEPIARITLRNPPPAAADDKHAPAEPVVKSATKAPAAAGDAKNDARTVTIIDGSSGKRQDVVIGAGDPAEKTTDGDAPPLAMTGIDPRLLEKSRYGMIPLRSPTA
ncbi:hypothetical protein ACVW1C_004232 [Bradyrhizobium sp. USDA 4011]